VTPVVEGPADDVLLGWSPNDEILFTSAPRGPADLFALEMKTGNPVGKPRLISNGIGDVALSIGFTRAGDFYYTLRPAKTNVYTVTIDGPTGQVLGTPELMVSQFAGSNAGAWWSPDGKTLAFATKRLGHGYFPSFMFLSADRERVFEPKLLDHRFITWAPDGTIVTFGMDEMHAGWFRVNPATGEARFLTSVAAGDQIGFPEVSPDNKSIYFRSERRSGIYRRDLQTGKDEAILTLPPPASFRSVRLSPDGTQLAFMLTHGRSQTISIMPADGGVTREVVRVDRPESLGSNAQPLAWSTDGKFLFFVRSSNGATELCRFSIEGGSMVRTGVAMEAMGWLHAHPEGRRLSFSAGHSPNPELWIVPSR
jgi:Tol biopolymer transport system component